MKIHKQQRQVMLRSLFALIMAFFLFSIFANAISLPIGISIAAFSLFMSFGLSNKNEISFAGNNGVRVLNTPGTAVQAHNLSPILTIPPGTNPAFPQGATVQAHPTIPNAVQHVDTSGGGMGASPGISQPAQKYPYAPNAKYQYDIIVTRLTYTIAGALPFVIGIGDEFDNQYSDFLGQIPGMATTTPVAVTLVAGGILDFEYTVSGNTDHVQVSCAQTPYSRLLKIWEIHRFKVVQGRVSLSDTTALGQFNVSLKTGRINKDTEVATKPLSYVANDSPYQYQGYKIDIARDMYVSKDEGILSGLYNNGANNFAVTFSLFITETAPTFTPVGSSPSNSGAIAGASI